MSTLSATFLQLRSTVRTGGTLDLSFSDVPMPVPVDDEVLVRLEAAPINPSDIGLMFGAADLSTIQVSGSADRPRVTGRIPERAMKAMAGRLDMPLPVGNEGAGTVVRAGASPEAQALLGRRVAMFGGAMYAQYRLLRAEQCLRLPDGTTAEAGAACFVNPLTALGMVETMRLEGHRALVHTAAASNLGQMLLRICHADGIPLVNIVRAPAQAERLRDLGATHVCDTSSPSFTQDLLTSLIETGATIAFDATGGGTLAGQILRGMEGALTTRAAAYSPYGTTTHKQVYVYGRLESAPLELAGGYGMAWSVGGWLLSPFLERIGPQATARLRARVVDELTSTFVSHYARTIALPEILAPDAIDTFTRRATATKVLVDLTR